MLRHEMAYSRVSSTGRLCYRYRYFFIATLLILVIQLLVGYNTDFRSIVDRKKNRPRSLSQYSEEEYIDNGKDPPKRDNFEFTVRSIQPVNLSEGDTPLLYKPRCHLTSEETISAISRAKTTLCKQEIADAACLAAEGKLFPKSLPNYCPKKGNHSKGHYYGCYQDKNADRDLPHQIALKENSVSTCIDHCLQIGYKYAGMQYGDECFCGQSFGKYGKIPDQKCSRPCPEDPNVKCGGFSCNSVYSTGVQGPQKNKFSLVHNIDNVTRDGHVRILFVFTINGRQVRQVQRLLKTIYHKMHYYFIHVDMRQEYLFRELRPLENLLPNVFLARRRFATIWGGASLLQAHLEFMKEVLQKEWKWDYYINLSESDYPIKKLQSLELFLTKYKGYNFLKSHGHYTDRFIVKQGMNKMFLECDTHMWRLGPRRLPTGVVFDGGSDWIGLHRDFVKYVITSDDDLLTGLKTFFEYTLLPAESFFHTVLHNSEFCDRWMDNNLHMTNWRRKQGCKCQHKHVVDWCGCSPNDLLSNDLDRLLNYENRATFFARKFEAVVNQDIINSMDVNMFGQERRDLMGLTNFWQNEYHYLDSKQDTNDVYLSFYHSFTRRAAVDLVPLTTGQCLVTPDMVRETHVLYQSDRFHGVLVKYDAMVKGGGKITLESHFLAKRDYKVLDPTGNVGRLINIEVGSNYDVKENIFRNYAMLLGPYSDLAVKHLWGPGPTEFTVSIAFIDPANIIAVSHDVEIPKRGYVGSHKPDLITPLRPGVWHCKLMLNFKVVVDVEFLVLPLTSFHSLPISLSDVISIHNGPENNLYHTRNFSDFKDVLQIENNSQFLKDANMNGRKIGKELEQWVDTLTKKFWEIYKTCFVEGDKEYCGALEACRQTYWSSLSPDPKSEIHHVNHTSGHLL